MKTLSIIVVFVGLFYLNGIVYGLSCYTCENCKDLDTKDENIKITCPKEAKLCYTTISGDGKWKRGCFSDSVTEEKVLKCDSDLCNKNTTTLQCYECKGGDCNQKLPSKPQDCGIDEIYCYEQISATDSSVERGCASKAQCKNFACKECQSAGCNKDLTRNCYACDIKDDPNCVPKGLNKITKTCTTFNECFSCLSPLNDLTLGCEPAANQPKKCRTCSEEKCNLHVPTTCVFCKSDKAPECVRKPNTYRTEICNDPSGICVTRKNGTVTVRGCINKPCNSDDCQSCEQDKCNTAVLNSDTKKCAICDSKNPNCNNEQKPSDLKPCKTQADDTQCFAYVDDKKNIVRGCQSKESIDEGCAKKGKDCIIDVTNTFSLYQTFSCHQCNKNDKKCKFGQSSSDPSVNCKFIFNETPSCYTNTAITNEISRGCGNAADACTESKDKCVKCQKNNCNYEAKMVQMCIQCDDKNSNCVNPTNIAPTQCTKTPSFDNRGCYAKKTDTGVIRGCLADLSQTEIDSCLSGAGNCKACQVEGCVPDSGSKITCYKCSSKTDLNCLHLNNRYDFVNCETVGDLCITATKDGYTVRGCKNETEFNSNRQHAECSDSFCNDLVLTKDQAICYSCGDDNSIDMACSLQQDDKTLKKCENTRDSCYAYINPRGGTVRGCSSDYNFQNCASDNCQVWMASKSNAAPLQKSLDCFKCDPSDPRCIWQQITTKVECKFLTNENPQCYTKILNDTSVARGCGNDKDACTEPGDKCKICHFNGCNDKTEIEQKCIKCSSHRSNGTFCLDNPQKLQPELCVGPDYATRGCYTLRYFGSIIRGCVSELQTFKDHCLSPNAKTCDICQTELCNVVPMKPLRCYNCSSNENSDCLHLNKGEKFIKECNSVLDTCITGSNPLHNRHTVRGCLSEVLFDRHSECGADLCNTKILPEDYAKCYTCGDDNSNIEECNKLSSSSNLKTCENINDSCYAYVNQKGGMVRGCSSEENYRNCKSDNCVVTDIPGGNSYVKETDITCSQCKSDDNACAWYQEPKLKSPVSCQFKFPKQPGCFTHTVNGTIISRGCTNDDGSCKPSEDGCELCETSNCNKESKKTQSCIQCTSSTPTCQQKAENIPSTTCNFERIDYGHSGCYTARYGKNVTRGCTASLNIEEIQKCKNNRKKCALCNGDGCNNQKAPNAGHSVVKGFSSLTVTVAVMTLVLFIIN